MAEPSYPIPSFRSLQSYIVIIAQLFGWDWTNVASECQAHLAPYGYDYVQVSPPTTHVRGPQWWTDYQPVSYALNSKNGAEASFVRMVEVCREAGVGVLVGEWVWVWVWEEVGVLCMLMVVSV